MIKNFPLSAVLISAMLRHRWWRYAPWKLTHLDITKPQQFPVGLQQMQDTPPFAPGVFDLNERPS
jgi:hypothetical protein